MRARVRVCLYGWGDYSHASLWEEGKDEEERGEEEDMEEAQHHREPADRFNTQREAT